MGGGLKSLAGWCREFPVQAMSKEVTIAVIPRSGAAHGELTGPMLHHKIQFLWQPDCSCIITYEMPKACPKQTQNAESQKQNLTQQYVEI